MLLSSLSMACVMEEDTVPAKPEHPSETEPVVEIILFYGTHRCTGCINVGKWTEEVVHTYYEDEVGDGTVMFQEINAETNPKIAAEYGWANAYD